MALLFIDGFDHYDPQALDDFGEPWLARGKAAYLSPQATRVQGRRPSSFALRLPEGSGGGYVKNLDSTKTSLIIGASIRVVPYENTYTEPLLLGVRDANAQVAHLVKVGEDGRLKLYRWQYGYEQLITTSVTTAPARGWHYIELQVTQGTSNGVLSVRINGVLAIQMTAQNTIQGGGQLLTAFLGAIPCQSCPLTLDVDDFYIADTTGTINNTFLGDVRVDALQAQADGSLSQWTVTPSGTAAWEAVSDEDETTHISAPSAGLRQSFDVAPLPVMATPAVFGVQLTMLARKTDAGLGKLKGLVVSGAQTAVSPEVILQEQQAWQCALFERNPNGNVQWTEAAFNAAEFGMESA
ncbi:hypothetical protein U8047_002318 [Pseudomonas aeruginosa]|uniref:hypothetical protein n=1 Tax=Pseudomonas aeruginosa TaxID=287 RepID=UPI0011EB87B7|nr:hypothetical protein [Pseudomonas aeruginosa]EMB2821337.1 hypothetical protein [Pseudomonas aeruginosa]TYT59241.1 hypothetical protein FZC29_00995 [Pseudomonas aeruginosa]